MKVEGSGHTLHFTGDGEKAWDRPRGALAFADHLPTKLSAEGLPSEGAGRRVGVASGEVGQAAALS